MVFGRNVFCQIALGSLLFHVASSTMVAAEAPGWKPYRKVYVPVPAASVATPQFFEEIPASRVHTDIISDVELDQLRASCCQDSFVQPYIASEQYVEGPFVDSRMAPIDQSCCWTTELLPADVIWQSYWAGAKEPRISGTVFQETGDDLTLFDITLGGRTSIWRYGYTQAGRPQGWELQLEGAGMLRLNLDHNWDFEAVDFRFGVPLIYGNGDLQWKFAYYHLSSHVGDEFQERNPMFERINFSRDTLVVGASFFPRPVWRWYAEIGWAFYADEGTDPWELQFGIDFARPGPTGKKGIPFLAVNGHLREEVNFGGNLVAQAGWLWRGNTGRVLRTGLHYFNGKSNQFEFYNNFEQQIGWGIWQDY
ncbi:MAG TPA: hypothetical protein DHW22_02370 [Planctomycetaceae bacterium]|nr:hypothetical protein [Planctomycetaceae bacterium]